MYRRPFKYYGFDYFELRRSEDKSKCFGEIPHYCAYKIIKLMIL